MHLFDSHCHLQDERIKDRLDGIIARAREAGVTAMLCCGTRESDWDDVAGLSQKYPEIIPAFGLHPWFVKDRSLDWLIRLEATLTEYPQAILGEIGLDHALDERNDGEQAEAFIAQLRLARRLGRPLSIHCRKAWAALLSVLEQQCGLSQGGVIHAYSGPPDLIEPLVAFNASFSFSGSITYDRNKRGCRAAAAVPDARLLMETDTPDIPPQGIASGENEPAYLIKIAGRLAGIRGLSIEAIAELTYANAESLFKPA
jgi:TatD DNase family protein